MSKKTPAYGEGYVASEAAVGLSANPYDKDEQSEQHTDWKTGYADGIADNDETGEEGFEGDDEDDRDSIDIDEIIEEVDSDDEDDRD